MPTPTAAQLSALYSSINNSTAFSATQRANALSSVNSAYGGGSTPSSNISKVTPPNAGTTGNAAGSTYTPTAPAKAPAIAGTVSNPAGFGLPTGTVAKNMTAANTATAIGPKKPDWLSQLEAIQASGVKSQQTGGQVNLGSEYNTPGGMSSPVNDIVNKAKNFNNQQTPEFFSQPRMTKDPNFKANIKSPIQNQAYALDGFNSALGRSGSLPQSTNSDPLPDNNWQETLSNTTTSPTPPVKTQSSMGITNVNRPAPTLSETTTQQGIVDETRKQADAAAAAAESATNSEDKKYYTGLYNQAKAEADKADADYQALIGKSAEENQTQTQLDSELQALQMGKTDVAGQPIPLSFITGQQSALERRSLDRTAPLTSKLGQLQSSRQAALTLAQERKRTSENKSNTAESNLTNLTTEQRKRQQTLSDTASSNKRADATNAQSQSNINRKFEEEKRQYGLDYATKQREIAIQQQNANTAASTAQNKGSTDVQLKQEINKVLATSNFQNASTQDKKNYILSQGGDPVDFGY